MGNFIFPEIPAEIATMCIVLFFLNIEHES